MTSLKPVKFGIWETFMYNGELVLCLINIATSRKIKYKHGHRDIFCWMEPKHWIEFEEGFETILHDYFQNKSLKKGHKSFNIGCNIKVNFRKPHKQSDVLQTFSQAKSCSASLFFECDVEWCKESADNERTKANPERQHRPNGLLNNNSMEPHAATSKHIRGTSTATELQSSKPGCSGGSATPEWAPRHNTRNTSRPHKPIENATEESGVPNVKSKEKKPKKSNRDTKERDSSLRESKKSSDRDKSSHRSERKTHHEENNTQSSQKRSESSDNRKHKADTDGKSERVKDKSLKSEKRPKFTDDLFGTDDESDANSKTAENKSKQRETRSDRKEHSAKKSSSSSAKRSKSKESAHSRKSSKKVKSLSLADMSLTAILDTFDEYRPILDEVYRTEHQKYNIIDYNGVDHYIVMTLLDDNIQMEMLKKLTETYKCSETQEFTNLFTNAMLPEWILNIVMKRRSLRRDQALKQISDENTYDALYKNPRLPKNF